jgi:hypothetical protein
VGFHPNLDLQNLIDSSGLRAATSLGAVLPFKIKSVDRNCGSMGPAIAFELIHELFLLSVQSINWIIVKLVGSGRGF